MMIKVGILGAGFMGVTHARAFARLPQAQVAAVADTVREKAEKLAAEVGSRAEVDPQALLNDPHIAVIDVTLPTPFHPQYAIAAFEAGKHVIVEKPLALSVEDADAMIEAANRAGKYLLVAHVLRFWPEYVTIREILQSGKLGKPISASAYRLSNMPQWATWFQDPKVSGGTILDLAIHDIDMMTWLFGLPRSVFASGAGEQNGDNRHVFIQADHGEVKTSVEASFVMPRDAPFSAGIRVVCERGMLEYKFQAGGASLEQGMPSNIFLMHEPGQPNQPLHASGVDAYEAEIAYFVDCLDNNRPPLVVTGEAGREAVKVALCARESMKTGLPVRVLP
jgi:predicted dehydrogenase